MSFVGCDGNSGSHLVFFLDGGVGGKNLYMSRWAPWVVGDVFCSVFAVVGACVLVVSGFGEDGVVISEPLPEVSCFGSS